MNRGCHMAGVSNCPQHPRGPPWLMYSRALGGAVREGTPSLAMWDGAGSKLLNAQTQIPLRRDVIVLNFLTDF